MCVNWSSSSLFKQFRHLTYRLLYWWQYLHINIKYTTYKRAYKHINSKFTTVCYCYSTVRMSQLQTSKNVTFLEVRNMDASHRQWYGSSTSRKRMSQYSSMSATCRLHTENIHCPHWTSYWKECHTLQDAWNYWNVVFNGLWVVGNTQTKLWRG